MGTNTAGVLFALSIVVALVIAYRPMGDLLHRTVTGTKHTRFERGLYRVMGVDPEADQAWGVYLRSVLAFSIAGIGLLYAILRLQKHLGLNLGFSGMSPALAFNTAASFVTNTNWQAYSGESTLGHVAQAVGLTVQNFVSAAVGIAVAVALARGLARHHTDRIGNFWVDVTRLTVRVLLPLCVLVAVVFIAGGVIENLHGDHTISTIAGGSQTITGGPVASQEAIKEFGTNGGGFYNVNSAHPFENPTAWTNWLQIFLFLVIPFSLPRTFGRLVGSTKQGLAIVAVMATLAIGSMALDMTAQAAHHGTVPVAVGAASEGTETRFGIPDSAVFATGTTLTSTGAVDSFHDSYTALAGGTLLVNMMLGEVAPGGTGSGLYGMLILAVVTVFIAGLMVGRTPEYLGKKIGRREITYASLYFLTTPALVLVGTGVAMSLPGERAGMLNAGPHGLSEVLYSFTSAANNNGSAFAGITVNTDWYNTALGIVMILGRFLPMIFVLALAGSLARQQITPASAGTLPTHRPQFVLLLIGVTVVLVALTYFPTLALGPLAEGLHT